MARPSPSPPGPDVCTAGSSFTEHRFRRTTSAGDHGRDRSDIWRCALATLALLLVSIIVGCGAGGTSESAVSEDEIEAGGAQPDFSATGITAVPNELLQTDLITIDATINNLGTSPTSDFEVRAFLKRGTNCDDTSFFIGAQTISVAGSGSTAFQTSRVIDNVTAVGTYYLCIQIDALDQVVESNENNNLIGGTTYPVYVVNCVNAAACDDGNPCTDDTCESLIGCQYAFNSGSCDDGLFCTVNDVCGGGRCQSGTARDCADQDLCDGTMLCDEQAGACSNNQPPPACDDGDACNGLETCNPSDGACIAGTPITCDNVINNALAPPLASNVIADASFDAASDQLVYVRNLGCPIFGDPDSFCPISGPATAVEVTLGADVGDMSIFDTSTLLVTGGSVDQLSSGQSSSVVLGGGSVEHGVCVGPATISAGTHDYLRLEGDATVTGGTINDLELDSSFPNTGATIRGGRVTNLFAGSGSSIRGGRISVLSASEEPSFIYGTGFDVNGGKFGALPGSTGFISGLLESGDTLNATFHQSGSWWYHPEDGVIDTNGSFTLLPPESTFIANGLTSSNPQNVIDASDTATQNHDVFVRNAGCPDLWPDAFREGPCTSPGSPTDVEVQMGASILGEFWVRDSSMAVLRGGQIAQLRQSADSLIEVWGDSFTVGGLPVPFGVVGATTGTLAGTLASGEAFSSTFDREDPSAAGTYGTIVLISAADLAAGTGVTRSLFGGLSTVGGIAVDLDIETAGTLSGSYELVPYGLIEQTIPDFQGLTIAAQSIQGQYQIWELDFSGVLDNGGTSSITFAYDPALVAPGNYLIVYGWDGSEWVRLKHNVVIDTENHTISMDITSFTIFALIVRTFLAPALSVGASLALIVGLAGSGLLARRRRAEEK